jgi:hypothetical protein
MTWFNSTFSTNKQLNRIFVKEDRVKWQYIVLYIMKILMVQPFAMSAVSHWQAPRPIPLPRRL